MAKKNSHQEMRGRRKNTSFSIVANPIIDDKTITPAAGWLYVLIQRWLTFNAEGFICSKTFLASKYQSGYRMFNRAWDELKEAGYLKMYSHPTEGWEFDLLDEPKLNEPHTYYLDLNGEIKSTNVDRAAKKAAKQAETVKENEEKDHYPQNDSNGNDSNGNDNNGNEGNIINTSVNTPINTIYNTNNQSIYHSNTINIDGAPSRKREKTDRLIDADTIRDVKEQIEYEMLSERIDRDFLDTAVNCVAELYATNKPMTFNNREYSLELVRQRSLEIKWDHIEYVFECFREQREKVYNVKKYLLTSIFNAPDTKGSHYINKTVSAGLIGEW